jgi:hypothetical protein
MVSKGAITAIEEEHCSTQVEEAQVGTVTISSDGTVSLDRDIQTRDYTLLVQCDSIQQAVLSPPLARLSIKDNRLVAWRRVEAGIATPA